MLKHDHRFLDLEGADNVRDLGELPTAHGQRTRSRKLLRAEFTHALTKNDVSRLPDLRVLIDLRSKGEISSSPLPWPGKEIVQTHCPLPLLSGEKLPTGEVDLVATYLGYLEINCGPMIKAIRIILDPDKLSPLLLRRRQRSHRHT